jgi:hypothetical protein
MVNKNIDLQSRLTEAEGLLQGAVDVMRDGYCLPSTRIITVAKIEEFLEGGGKV